MPPRAIASDSGQALELVAVPTGNPHSAAHPTRLDVVLTVLHVQIPRAQREHTTSLWSHVREDVLDTATQLRLRRNGVRVGIGHGRWWDAVKAVLSAVEGVNSIALDPVRVPAGFPLALQLDMKPREQTLFYVADDGILTGESWPHSRNVLRVSYDLDLESPQCARLAVVPEVRQRLDGWRWVRNAAGISQLPNYNGRAFAAASFTADLEPGEFLLIAPGKQADLYGMIGGALLEQNQDGVRYDSYVFLHVDVNHVACRN